MTKASVSVVFNNADRERSPVGYEEQEQITVTRQVSPARSFSSNVLSLVLQIVIGGRNKYLINGHVAQPRSATLYHSARLLA